MPAAYGFKATDPKDALAISNLMSQADSVEEKHYDTLAQYRINDVQLKPATLSLGLPRQWMLTMNTTMTGFNRPNNQSLFFRNDKNPVGDGYVTYPLSSKEFGDMIKGGLYDNPQGYVRRLNAGLANHEFYRKTNVNLTTATLLDSRLLISAGDLRERKAHSREYMIGNDLNSYADFGQNKDLQSNLSQVLAQQTDEMVKNPVQKREPTEEKTVVHEAQPMPELPNVQINSEVDMKIDKARLDRLRNLDKIQAQGPQSPSNESSVDSQASLHVDLSDLSSSADRFDHSAASSQASASSHAASLRASLERSEEAANNNDNSNGNDEFKPSAQPSANSVNEHSQAPRFNDDQPVDDANTNSSNDSYSSQEAPLFNDGENHDNVQNDQPQAQVDESVNEAPDGGMNFDDMMSELTGGSDDSQTVQRRRRHQHAYVDDFGQALQDSKASQQNQLTKKRNLQRQHDEAEHAGPDI